MVDFHSPKTQQSESCGIEPIPWILSSKSGILGPFAMITTPRSFLIPGKQSPIESDSDLEIISWIVSTMTSP